MPRYNAWSAKLSGSPLRASSAGSSLGSVAEQRTRPARWTAEGAREDLRRERDESRPWAGQQNAAAVECRRRASSASKRGRGGLRSGAEGSPKQAGALLMRRAAARAAASQPGQRAPGQATLTCSRAAGVHEAERVPQRLVLGEHGVEVVVQVRRRLLPERGVEARREGGVAHARPGEGDELAHLRVRVRCWR